MLEIAIATLACCDMDIPEPKLIGCGKVVIAIIFVIRPIIAVDVADMHRVIIARARCQGMVGFGNDQAGRLLAAQGSPRPGCSTLFRENCRQNCCHLITASSLSDDAFMR